MSVRKVLLYSVVCNVCRQPPPRAQTFDGARDIAGAQGWKVSLSGMDDLCPPCRVARERDNAIGVIE